MKKITSLFLVLVAALTVFISTGTDATAEEAIAISTAEEFLAMVDNPGGSYYLTQDITIPENTSLFSKENPFAGTLDGKNHKIKGYKYTATEWCRCGIFYQAKGASFKNISLTNVDINIQSDEGTLAGVLVGFGEDCT